MFLNGTTQGGKYDKSFHFVLFDLQIVLIKVKIFSAVYLSSNSSFYFPSIKSWPLRMLKLWVGPFLTLRMYIKVKVKRFVWYTSPQYHLSMLQVSSFDLEKCWSYGLGRFLIWPLDSTLRSRSNILVQWTSLFLF